jgi:hypothetical protein
VKREPSNGECVCVNSNRCCRPCCVPSNHCCWTGGVVISIVVGISCNASTRVKSDCGKNADRVQLLVIDNNEQPAQESDHAQSDYSGMLALLRRCISSSFTRSIREHRDQVCVVVVCNHSSIIHQPINQSINDHY